MFKNAKFPVILLSMLTALVGLMLLGMALLGAAGALAQENQPDGPVVAPVEGKPAAEGSGEGLQVSEAQALPSSSSGEGLPEGASPVAAWQTVTGPDSPEAPSLTFSHYRLLGTAFNPRSSSTTFAYTSNGCVYETGGTDNRFMAPLLLPNGAVIKYLRFYFNDTNSTSDLTAWITRYQPGVTNEDLTSVTSTGSTGYDTTLSPEITHTVDLTNWAYTLIIAPNANTSTSAFCGVRVAYYAPSFGAVALPMILK